MLETIRMRYHIYIVLLLVLILARSCEHPDSVFFFPIPESRLILVVENEGNKQILSICNNSLLLDKKNRSRQCPQFVFRRFVSKWIQSSKECSIDILYSDPTQPYILFLDYISNAVTIEPHCSLVVTNAKESMMNDKYEAVSIQLPLNGRNDLCYQVQGKSYTTHSVPYEIAFSILKEYNPESRGCPDAITGQFPPFFLDKRKDLTAPLIVQSLEDKLGFTYSGTRIECKELSNSELDEVNFYLDPNLPDFLFYHSYYSSSSDLSFHLLGKEITLVVTSMYIFSPGIHIDVCRYFGNSYYVDFITEDQYGRRNRFNNSSQPVYLVADIDSLGNVCYMN